MKLRFAVYGRVADARLKAVQTFCPSWVQGVLRERFTGTFTLVCNGTASFRVHPEPLRVYRSKVVPRTIIIEAWPRSGFGVIYGLISPDDVDVEIVLKALESRLCVYVGCIP